MPAIPWDTTLYCCELEAGFISSLLGLGQILKLYRAWDGTDEEIEAIMPQVEKGLLALMGSVCCDGVASMEQTKSGYLVSIDQDGNRTYISSTTTAAEIAAMPTEYGDDHGDDNVCAGVNLVVERLLDDVLFSLDQAQFVIDQYKTGAEALSAIINTIPLLGVPMATAFDGWEEWVTAAATLTISTLKIAFSDPAVKHKMRENMYCNIVNRIGNVFLADDYFDAVGDLPLLESQSAILSSFMRGFDIPATGDIFATVERWYYLGTLNSDNTCAAEFECDDYPWTHEFDFTLSDGGWSAFKADSGGVAPYAVYESGVGWKANIASGSLTAMHINYLLPNGIYDYCKIDFSPSPVGTINFAVMQADLQALNSYVVSPVHGFFSGLTTTPRTQNTSPVTASGWRVFVAFADTTDPETVLTIHKITFGGIGANPFE